MRKKHPITSWRQWAIATCASIFGVASANGEDGRSVIPLTLTEGDYGGGRVYLPVRLGNLLGSMRLDTGASTSRILIAPWNKDLPSLGQSTSLGVSGGASSCEDVMAKDVELKATQGNNIARANYPVSRCPASAGDDLLGLDYFKGSRFSLDFARREMIFFGEAQGAGRPRGFRLVGPEPHLLAIELRTGDIQALGLFDTGAEISAVDQRFVAKHKNLFKLVKSKSMASEAGGKRLSAKLYSIKEIDIGEGRTLRGVFALVYDFGILREALGNQTPFILGYNFLSRFQWRLDLTSPNAPSWDAKPR